MLKKILGFLGGKNPDIFNEKGEVEHKTSDDRWQAWEQKMKSDPEYNWRQHSGRTQGKKSYLKAKKNS